MTELELELWMLTYAANVRSAPTNLQDRGDTEAAMVAASNAVSAVRDVAEQRALSTNVITTAACKLIRGDRT
jgi:hypothetical protein